MKIAPSEIDRAKEPIFVKTNDAKSSVKIAIDKPKKKFSLWPFRRNK